MVFNTVTVAGVVTPAVIQTFLSHYLNRKKRLEHKPTAHISYDEGLHLVKKFLLYASHHTVEDIQRFTGQWVPTPRWVKLDRVTIPAAHVAASADAIHSQLGPRGVERVGGTRWWQWRRPGSEEMTAEWIEMRSDYLARQSTGDPGRRVMLYVHGGGYFFGSVDAHRYQLQRHARKLNARVLARDLPVPNYVYIARYRLAPQFPFPCGLHDCLATYLYLLSFQDPTTIVVAGDSAGGGMVLSMLIILRDQGIPLPAGAILISPWVDLTHSFPSVAGDGAQDYIPPQGFHQKPSPSWPPPNAEDVLAMKQGLTEPEKSEKHVSFPDDAERDAVRGFHIHHNPHPKTQNATAHDDAAASDPNIPLANTVPGHGKELSIMINGKLIEIKDQVQMYTTNQMVSHPLVSPILQPSLGGLPPLLVLVGGGELLKDEQVYLAHKAANPEKYPPGDAFLDDVPDEQGRNHIKRWKPTDVQLQVWDDLCHVAPTLSFTKPAKYMYRSVAQFGAWALARAQHTEIEIVDDDAVSMISKSDSESEERRVRKEMQRTTTRGQVGKAGDPLPHFKNHMIRQRVDRHGNIFDLEPESELPGCCLDISEIGVIKAGTLEKWMDAKRRWDVKFATAKRKVQKQRAMEFAKGYQQFGPGEKPPPSALAGRRLREKELKEEKRQKSAALSLWALWGSKHDEEAIEHERQMEQMDEGPDVLVEPPTNDPDAAAATRGQSKSKSKSKSRGVSQGHSRSRSRRRIVMDENQTEDDEIDADTPAHVLNRKITRERGEIPGAEPGMLTPDFLASPTPSVSVQPPPVDETELKRPKLGGIAFPFSLKQDGRSASMLTLTSSVGVAPAKDLDTAVSKDSGVAANEADIEAALAARRSSAAPPPTEPPSATDAATAAERPVLETFFSAQEDLPKASKE